VLLVLAAIGPLASAGACVGEAKAPSRFSEQMARAAVICLVNERRGNAGLGPLTENGSLNNSAQGHAVWMAKRNRYEHGNSLRRIRATGYLAGASTWTVGEALGWGFGRTGSPKHIVSEWMHSPDHRRDLLGGFHDIGVGVTKGAPFAHFGHNTATYTVDLGSRG
jgi:uncharacterized protein YkwD